ncbi:hypothetical protein PHYBOEH_000362 [Phytophthora boehmeriae]|uniref:RxLR effector protein n=1 Tax=Phytophthora boehmeriae TaxID=109152 RepID=A0A8T1WW64_9STRA|nr:hypothetical protein PHYBOEH_000362 [Phytophthora boehmeriae]
MRACYLFLAVVTTVLANAGTTASMTADSKQSKIAKVVSSSDTAPSTLSLTARDNNVRNRALRGTGIDNLIKLGSLDDDADDDAGDDADADLDEGSDGDDDDGNPLSEDEEERAGGTSIVKSIHNIKDYRDAKMLRQIAKGNSPNHILDKFNVAYKIINGQRVYSKHDPDYARYLYWVKYNRDRRFSA